MRTLNGATALLLGALAVSLLPGPVGAAADAAARTCQGREATIVKETGTVAGTDGDDVIIGGPYTVVLAGPGDDIVCVTGGTADGGEGSDSIEMVGHDIGEGTATVVDFERLDVRTFFYLGEVVLRWTEVPSTLKGSVVADYYPDQKMSRVLDNPTVRLEAPETSEDGITVDLRHHHVRLGEGLGFSLTGVHDVGVTAHKVRAVGDRYRNYFFLSGCDVVARGGGGNDRLWMTDRKVDRHCPGARLHGQQGPDYLQGTKRSDVLLGGPGRDHADGRAGRDRCVAEHESSCER